MAGGNLELFKVRYAISLAASLTIPVRLLCHVPNRLHVLLWLTRLL
jgi:hypothetical protein